MARNYSNIALDTTLTAGITAGDLTCVVVSAAGWPSVPFAAVLDPGSLTVEEVVQVTLKVGTTFTITRGFDGTAAAAHALGAVVRHAAIAGDFTDLQAADALRLLISNYDWSTLPNKPAFGSLALLNSITASLISDASANGQSLITAANYAAMRTLLSLAALALKATIATADVDNDAITYAKIQDVSATDRLLGRVSSGSGNVEEVTFSDFGQALLADTVRTANQLLAGPTSGADAAPAFRTLVSADLIGTQRRPNYYEAFWDFENGVSGTPFVASNSGTGSGISAVALSSVGRVGLVGALTGTTTTGRAGANLNSTALVFSGGVWTWEAQISSIFNLSDGTETYAFYIGFLDSLTAEPVDGAYFEYDSVTSANWRITTSNNSTRTKTTTSTAVAAATAITLKIIVNAAGTLVTFYIDNVSVGTSATNIPITTARATAIGWNVIKSAGTTTREIDLDWIYARCDLTSSRTAF